MLSGAQDYQAARELARLREPIEFMDIEERLLLASTRASLAETAAIIELAKTIAACAGGAAYPRADWDVVLGYSEYEREDLATRDTPTDGPTAPDRHQ